MMKKTLSLKQVKELMAENNGNLNLAYSGITRLPDNLTVGGSLDLENTPITKLPDNLTVGGDLNLQGTAITELPDNLMVGNCILPMRESRVHQRNFNRDITFLTGIFMQMGF